MITPEAITRDELIEAMALAIFNDGHTPEHDDRDGQSMAYCRDFAQAALTAIEAQGLAIVPVEATEAMENSAEDLGANGPLSVDCWEAMMRVGRL